MYRSIRRLLSRFPFGQNRPDPLAASLLGLAAQQQAIFQMLVGGDKAVPSFRYMVCRGIRGDGVILASRGPGPSISNDWRKREFSFRFLIQTDADKFPRLHKFQGRITEIHQDRKTITVGIPARIVVLEQRRNVRLKLHRRHLPGLAVWGLAKGKAQRPSRVLEQRFILDLADRQADEMQDTLKNISAGGMRLALPRQVYDEHEPWLAKGCHLLARLAFPGAQPDLEHAFEFIAKVSNALVPDDPDARPEIGVQFVSARGKGLHTSWRDVRADGCLELLRLLQGYQLEYYRDLKKNLILREEADGDPATPLGPRARGSAA